MTESLLHPPLSVLAAITLAQMTVFVAVIVLVFTSLVFFGFVASYGAMWFQAYMSGADITLLSLIGMRFRQVDTGTIVTAKIMGTQAGLDINRRDGLTTQMLEAHFLADGDVMNVTRAIIAAQRAGIDLSFDRAAAIDLAGRDVLKAVQTSVSPKVIDCPDPADGGNLTLSAIAKNGVELRIRARVTVRTNLDQLIGGATEKTVIARVGQGIVSVVGSSSTHMDVLEVPERISKSVLKSGLDTNTAFEIVSIDVTDIDVGENIGARLQRDRADADGRMARANAEVRRAEAIAETQKMKARVAENRVALVLAEAELATSLAQAFRAGLLRPDNSPSTLRIVQSDDWDDESIA